MFQATLSIKHVPKTLKSIWILLLSLSIAQPVFPADFYLRLEGTSSKEYQDFIISNHFVSFIDWQIEQLSRQTPITKNLDQALEQSVGDPIGSLAVFDKTLEELESHVLNANSRDLLRYILLKVESLKAPESYKIRYHQRLLALNQVSMDNNSHVSKATHFSNQELSLLVGKLFKKLHIEDALVLVDGVSTVDIDAPITLGNMPHQWVILSNTYAPLIYIGHWNDFLNRLNENPGFSSPLAVGSCDSSMLSSSSFQDFPSLMTANNAHIYSGSNCNTTLHSTPLMDNNHHLGEINSSSKKENSDSRIALWIASGLLIGGIATLYLNRDKQLSIEYPF